MLDEKEKKEIRSIMLQLIKENKIVKPPTTTESFFLDKARNSLQVAKRILNISEDNADSLESYMWVVNASYYCMFYAATALLSHFNHRIDVSAGIHKLTYHALAYYFLIDDKKLQKHFIEEYKESYEDAEQLLQISETKAVEMVKYFSFEHSKRIEFTYEIGKVAEKNKARTSLKRAENFLMEVGKIVRT